RPGRGRGPGRIPRPSRPPRQADARRRPPAAGRTTLGTRAAAPDAPPTRRGAGPGSPRRSCGEEETTGSQGGHAEEEPAVGEAANAGSAVGPLAAAHANLHDAQVELGGA